MLYVERDSVIPSNIRAGAPVPNATASSNAYWYRQDTEIPNWSRIQPNSHLQLARLRASFLCLRFMRESSGIIFSGCSIGKRRKSQRHMSGIAPSRLGTQPSQHILVLIAFQYAMVQLSQKMENGPRTRLHPEISRQCKVVFSVCHREHGSKIDAHTNSRIETR